MEQYLEDLLFRHECVIIPGFGGFVSNFSPAKVNPSTHTFSPPSRILTFNRNLNNNDGLLANHVAIKEQLTFQEALNRVKEFVNSLDQSLQGGQAFTIRGIGSFQSDRTGKLNFLPESGSVFLQESFGLQTFKSPPIRREELTKKIEKQFKDRVAPEVVEKGIRKRKVKVGRVVTLAILVPVLAALFWIPLKTDVMEQHGFADLNPFQSLKPGKFKTRTEEFKPLTAEELKEQSALVFTDADVLTTMSIDDLTPPLVVDLKRSPALIDNTKVETNAHNLSSMGGGKYHLIAGAFAVPSNADNYVIRLRAEGLSAGIMSQQFSALRYVEVGSFNSREEALSELSRIKGSRPEVWLLVK